MSRLRILTIVNLIILPLDQATKLYVDARFLLHESVSVIPGLFQLTYVRNKGAAFGILADSAVRIPFFITITVLALAGILWYLRQLHDRQWLTVFALSLVFAGALGNLIDRIRLGEVIDFLDVYWGRYHWPAFNVADSAITVGVTLLIVDMLREEYRRKHHTA
ncbi:MAG: signal peptidase II [Desulfuromonadales bacterium]|nr:signal peptidase II [Desulfuromonadales bacterium]